MASKQFSIGVIGHTGTVGSVVYAYFRENGYPTFGVSKGTAGISGIDLHEVNRADVIFICVPTPYSYETNTCDLTAVSEVFAGIKPPRIVIIKSTVPPGTTDMFQKKYPQLKILFSPEFLSRSTSRKDFEKPGRQIIGATDSSQDVAERILSLLPKGTYSVVMKAREAELVKYAHNVFGALVVTYANHLYDVAQAISADYEKVIQGFTGPEYLKGLLRYTMVIHNGKRGFGGPCFPKDINTFISFCASLGVKAEVVEAARDANRRILADQGLTEKSVEKF